MLVPFLLNNYDIKQVRLDYYEAVNSENAAAEFYDKLKKSDLSEPLLLAYYGAAEAVKAKHAWNPYNKIAYLKRGMKNLETAVSKSRDNLEIRFLRFSLEHYIPGFLGFNKHLEEDRKKIVELIQRKQTGLVDKTLLSNIISFMKESKRCTAAEIAILNRA